MAKYDCKEKNKNKKEKNNKSNNDEKKQQAIIGFRGCINSRNGISGSFVYLKLLVAHLLM